MKRSLEICSKCGHFSHDDDFGDTCAKCEEDRWSGIKCIVSRLIGNVSGFPSAGLVGFDSDDEYDMVSFEEKEVPKDCDCYVFWHGQVH